MGISPSKRVTHVLSTSSTFNTSCDTIYDETLTLSQHAFPGVPPYQLISSSSRLHHSLSSSLPLVSRWLPSPPSSAQVHTAYRSVIISASGEDLGSHRMEPRRDKEEEPCLDRDAFRAFAVRLFAGAVVENVGKAVMKRVPVGVVGIAGVGAVTRSGKDLVGAAVGVYALGVAASVYLSLAG